MYKQILGLVVCFVLAVAGVAQADDSWDKNVNSTTRFVLLGAFGNAAVKDKNTGLVWERSPDQTQRTWFEASHYCWSRIVSGTYGWRLPKVEELKGLLDPLLPPPYVPTSAFSGVQPYYYWTITSDEQYLEINGYVKGALSISLTPITVNNAVRSQGFANYSDIGNPFYAWCVRGE
jgi:hypothetical protein